MADAEAVKPLSGLLNGIAQRVYYGNSEITEELLKDELYPDVPQEEFRALYEKMRGLLKVWNAGLKLTDLATLLKSPTCSTSYSNV